MDLVDRFVVFFFFKQKTAYEMRISDWSSDVCSSDLAIRLVRSRASELKINPRKIGVIGFSAGGYLVAQTSNIFEPAYQPVDEIDKVSSRPDFAIAMFPGHLCRAGGSLDPGIKVTKMTPPTFLLQAWDDPVDPICNSRSEEHTSELQSLMRLSYAVFCLNKKNKQSIK